MIKESFSKVYKLGEGKLLGVDQSGIKGDKTALCFAKYNGDKMLILRSKLIPQQEDMDNFINKNMKELNKVFLRLDNQNNI
ncbi:TPA: hypothetical protein ACF2DD_001960 [Clostridium perfringens]